MADPLDPQGVAFAVRLLVDTGAELSVIPRDIMDALGRPDARTVEITGVVPGAFVRCPVFRVILHVAGCPFEVEVASLPRDAEAPDGILGRDVLAHLNLSYLGAEGRFTLVPAHTA